jgi:Protein of unknown function with HXXEE motif
MKAGLPPLHAAGVKLLFIPRLPRYKWSMPDDSTSSIVLWSWLFPLTYIIHIVEEFYGGEGYPAYLKRLRGVEMAPTKFLVGQGIGLALIILGILIARRFSFPRQLLIILAAVVMINGLTHLVTSSYYRQYGPGLISGVLIWIPLGIATLIRFKNDIKPGRYWLCFAIGVGINVAITLITLQGPRSG